MNHFRVVFIQFLQPLLRIEEKINRTFLVAFFSYPADCVSPLLVTGLWLSIDSLGKSTTPIAMVNKMDRIGTKEIYRQILLGTW